MFRCDLSACTYEKPFSGRYELERHKKNVHLQDPAVGNKDCYRCNAEHCNSKGAFWSRLDKFREHCRKKHPQLEIEGLVIASTLSESEKQQEQTRRSNRPATSIQREHEDFTSGSQDPIHAADVNPKTEEPEVQHQSDTSPGREIAVIVNSLPQPARRKAVEETIARADKVFSPKTLSNISGAGNADQDDEAVSGTGCDDSKPPQSTPAHHAPTEDNVTCSTERPADGHSDSRRSDCAQSSGLGPSENNHMKSNRDPQGFQNQPDEHSHHLDNESGRKRPRHNISLKLRPYPCVFHRFGDIGLDETPDCHKRAEFVSKLRLVIFTYPLERSDDNRLLVESTTSVQSTTFSTAATA